MKDMPPGAHCVQVTQHLQYCMERPMREANPRCYGSTEDAIPSRRVARGDMMGKCVLNIYIERGEQILKENIACWHDQSKRCMDG